MLNDDDAELAVTIPEAMYAELEQVARERGTDVHEVVVAVITDWFQVQNTDGGWLPERPPRPGQEEWDLND